MSERQVQQATAYKTVNLTAFVVVRFEKQTFGDASFSGREMLLIGQCFAVVSPGNSTDSCTVIGRTCDVTNPIWCHIHRFVGLKILIAGLSFDEPEMGKTVHLKLSIKRCLGGISIHFSRIVQFTIAMDQQSGRKFTWGVN